MKRFINSVLVPGLIIIYSAAAFSQSGRPAAVQHTPKALRPDIRIEKYMPVASKAVRLLFEPKSGIFYYTDFSGGVYRIKTTLGNPESELVFSAADHGITRLQGAVFSGKYLFLCGNISVNNNKGTKGRMVRYDMSYVEKPEMTVVFNTVEYGTNATTFDHGWNALEASADGKYIYANTGARTDHGEVQDNRGAYPNARDNALTAKIFRFPADAKDLELPNDLEKLKSMGYIYAEGIRNAYDIAFDAKQNLFAVVNSSDYDHNEDMFWVREGKHYGFPWVMSGIENPQQYPDWQPNPDTDPFIPRSSHAWTVKYFRNDPEFPKIPAGVKFSPGVQNLGPDANEYRGHSGKILDGDNTGLTTSTFTPHSSPLGLVFDTKNALSRDFKGDGFVLRNSLGSRSSMMKPFTNEGRDLLHLKLTYDKGSDNYFVKTTRIMDSFNNPTDAVLVGNELYVIEYDAREGSIWKITLPSGSGKAKKVKNN
ncbi:PQQ-dependent sugar dehydrogenase [Daejeonella sp. H1SJ63]|uniref:PQQ-dependent sugar dehydrogenase n=1 Tax=Daejeonella sp. H1SJ63 TaxID=3034145 RepID=UPI0023EC1EF6|nr:PQQ-dependent sugar dehydrogenase [Daejeonella sp. H1SJ63]